MRKPPSIARRLVLRRLTGGGAVLCTFSSGMAPFPARGAEAGRPPLLVLDPGHGGKDRGATGAAGTLEKDVTLASALALKAGLEASGRYRVELTRAGDRFVTREDRVHIAHDRGASLFLSLHADTYANTAVRGASVYTLAKRASDPATEALAARENGIVPGQVTPEVSEILASLGGRETRAISSRIARQFVRDLERDVPILPSPARQANFTVLHAAGIPSVLVEMGFLSNRADEAALNEAPYRELIARSLTRTIDAWFTPARDGPVRDGPARDGPPAGPESGGPAPVPGRGGLS